jgi:RNA polymerase sigma-70 factor (ECF subfamily)
MTSIRTERRLAIPPSPPPDCDEILLERMRADDEQAYRLLVERHIDRAYGLALRILRNAADAEDVVQDSLVKAWLNRKNWQAGRAKFSTWLYRVIVNRCIDLQRSPKSEWLENVPEPEDGADDSVTSISKRQMQGRLEDALSRLPSQQRIAVALSYFDDMSNGEIARVMEISVSAVESLLKRGRQGLRELLKRSESEVRHFLAES